MSDAGKPLPSGRGVVTLTLTITHAGSRLMEVGGGEMVLVPGAPEERAQAFTLLVEALSLLAGVPGPAWPVHAGGEPPESEMRPATPVVSLAERRSERHRSE